MLFKLESNTADYICMSKKLIWANETIKSRALTNERIINT